MNFSPQIFEKSSNIKFNLNPSIGSRVVPCGRTDRHDEAVVSGVDSKKLEHVSDDNRAAGSRRVAGSGPGGHLRIDIPESNQSK